MPPVEPVNRQARQIRLSKSGHEFRMSYQQGDEGAVLEALVDLVHRRDLPFVWFDAAVMSHQLGEHLAKELQSLMPKNAA